MSPLLVAAMMIPNAQALASLKDELTKKHGEAHKARIARGVDLVASLWRKEDGDLAAFARESFIADPGVLDATFARYEANFETIDGHLLEISRDVKRPTDLDVGPLTPIDALFAGYDPTAHLTEDLFANKVAFVALLNFPLTTLEERLAHGKDYSRRQWAEARLTGRFARRVPADVQQAQVEAQSQADLYISDYNLWMHHVLSEKGERLFPKGMRLISHWNLRDELKADYADPRGLEKQRTLVRLMERIVAQQIPRAVIDNPFVDWNPFSGAVTASPAAELEENAPKKDATPDSKAEPDTRYAKLLANFTAAQRADPFSPTAPTAIARAFDVGAELPEARVKALFAELLDSKLVPQLAAEIEKRLGRKLEPQDLWYNGFVPRGEIPEDQLDQMTAKAYPTAEAFAKDIPRILEQLGFSKDRAAYLAAHIVVDPSRGAGHALQSARRGDFPHLRTRVEKGGMNYKGYNIAIHELGHNVEQVLSLYDVDHTLLAGVPNTAFTEALAFVFQGHDLELLATRSDLKVTLGKRLAVMAKQSAEAERLRVLNDFWMAWEIAGVALVDVAVWHWLYEHPKATPALLREATMKIAKEIWNQHYAPVLGGKDSALLGIYSHMISYPLYLFNYPLGHLIAFQIEEKMRAEGKLGPEFERMAKYGAVGPDLWMQHATGAPVGAGPLLRATEAALAAPAAGKK
jgi:hypothetical protein